MRNFSLFLLAGVVALTACDSARKPSDGNFRKAIDQYLAKQGKTCTWVVGSFPVDVSESEQKLQSVSVHFELFTALSRQSKPVEMYYYPNEQHQPEHPVARISSLQRNIDWFRFWLQGYERPNPEDPDQYKRWEHLRELRDADNKGAEAKSH